MALERFIPKSPDMFIRNSQDFEVAKFGHLNTIVEYINNNTVQPAGLNGYVQFNDNNALGGDAGLFWDNVNKRLGVGTTTPINLLSIDATNSTLPTEHLAAAATIKSGAQSPLRVLRTGGQPNVWIGTSSTIPNISSFLFGIRTGAYYNTATPTYSGDYAAWLVSRGNDWGTATLASNLRMSQVFTCNGNTGRAALAIYPIPVETATNTDMVNMNNLLIATAGLFTAQPVARLQIIGDGSTSATTSLLVQNSLGTEYFKLTDDAALTFTGLTRLAITTATQINSRPVVFNTNGGGGGFNGGYDFKSGFGGFDGNTALRIWSDNANSKVAIGNIAENTLGGSVSKLYIDNTISGGRNKAIKLNVNFANISTEYNGIQFDTIENGSGGAFIGSQYNTATSGYGSDLAIFTTTESPTYTETARFVGKSQSLSIGAGKSPTARLQVKGSGSTSATTALLVQNSAGSTALQIQDDGKVLIGSNSMSVSGIYSPRDASFGNRTFLYNQDNVGLMQTVSNDQLRILRYCYFSEPINIQGAEIKNSSDGFYDFTGGLNPWGSSDSAQLNLNGNGRLQGSAFGKHIRIQGTMQLDSATNKLWGFYYNPTLTGAYSNQNVFAFQSTYGGGYFNTATPQASAILQADSTTQGFLPPRMTTAQKVTLAATAVAGLMIYDTNLNKLCVYTGAGWETITSV
jgi:hypothetical protein